MPIEIDVLNDTADPVRFSGLAALLDHDMPPWRNGFVPPLGHWLCFQPQALQSSLNSDGHPALQEGGLLPKSDLPRRMWAGSRITFHQEIPIGAKLTRRSRRLSATPKEGRSGRMLFVTLHHAVEIEGAGLAISEEQDIVYREPATIDPSASSSPPEYEAMHAEGDILSTRHPDELMLFRFSALTFNAHRIHYDGDYARQVEGYPGLVVHGPLIATLLMDHLLQQMPGASITAFTFRAAAPLFAGSAVELVSAHRGSEVSLTARTSRGVIMMASAIVGDQ